jgi:hypothetical protein
MSNTSSVERYEGPPVELQLPEEGHFALYIDGQWEDTAHNLDTGQTIVHYYIDEFIDNRAFFYPSHPIIEHEIDLVRDCFGS